MPARSVAVAVAGGLALAACAGGAEQPRPGASTPARPPGTAPAAAPTGTTPQERAGRLPERPQVVLDFATARPPEWPARPRGDRVTGGYAQGGYELRAPAGDTARAAAPEPVRPATRPVLLETSVRLSPGPARAGLFCRASRDGRLGYEFTLSREGRWRIDRVAEGRRTRLGGGVVSTETTVPGQPTLLRFLCGAGGPGENLTLGYMVNASAMRFVRDPRAVAPAAGGAVGLVVAGGEQPADALFRGLAVSYAVAGVDAEP